MKYEVKFTNQFKKDMKLAKKQNKDLDKLFEVVNILADGGTLDARYRDHDLSVNYKGTRECHHKMPLSEGGTHDRSNLIALCKSCHSTIHAKRGDYWGRTMSGGPRSCADWSGDPSRVGVGGISTGMAPRERRGGLACKNAKWKTGIRT